MAVIRVINPNSNQNVTDGLKLSLTTYEIPDRITVVCETLEEGPFGIETAEHVHSVAEPLLKRMRERPADAHVIACYSDPGLELCRAEISQPVFGIMESGLALSLTRGARFGVIALSEESISRHLVAIERMGLTNRLAAERALGASVAESAKSNALPALIRAGEELRDLDGADVIILGCAGMALHRGPLEETLGVPVIDPCQAAVGAAIAALLSRQ